MLRKFHGSKIRVLYSHGSKDMSASGILENYDENSNSFLLVISDVNKVVFSLNNVDKIDILEEAERNPQIRSL